MPFVKQIWNSSTFFHDNSQYQYEYNRQDAQSFVIRLYFQYMFYMFRTVSVHLQEQSFYKLYITFGTRRYMPIRLAVVLLQTYGTGIYQMRCTAYKRLLLKMDWYSPKHVEHILKIKSNHKNFVHLVGYIHIARWRMVRSMSQYQIPLKLFHWD